MAATFPLPPGSTIGLLGGGQLGRMMAGAASRLGFDVAVLDPDPNGPAARVAAHSITAAYDDEAALAELARVSDVITFEFENVPAHVIDVLLAHGAQVAPNGRALAVAQDRVTEKSFLNDIGVPTVAFAAIETAADIGSALNEVGAPALIKTRREGYDGKGQTWVDGGADALAAFERIGARPAILEAKAPFRRELSVIAARSRTGEVAAFPIGENQHEGGILRRTIAPADISREMAEAARLIAETILNGLDYVGVIGVELFELPGGRLLVNEIAPRVHNSGHWTLDGCEVDQFEQHIRAIAGWPLGPTDAIARTEMINLIGDAANDWAIYAAEPDSRLWLYGKAEARPGRKMGHVNRLFWD
ncbi:MAG: 5-(carboxyamino)imidazole ribonucleotide synthase [Caulobacteraceae bacterium]